MIVSLEYRLSSTNESWHQVLHRPLFQRSAVTGSSFLDSLQWDRIIDVESIASGQLWLFPLAVLQYRNPRILIARQERVGSMCRVLIVFHRESDYSNGSIFDQNWASLSDKQLEAIRIDGDFPQYTIHKIREWFVRPLDKEQHGVMKQVGQYLFGTAQRLRSWITDDNSFSSLEKLIEVLRAAAQDPLLVSVHLRQFLIWFDEEGSPTLTAQQAESPSASLSQSVIATLLGMFIGKSTPDSTSSKLTKRLERSRANPAAGYIHHLVLALQHIVKVVSGKPLSERHRIDKVLLGMSQSIQSLESSLNKELVNYVESACRLQDKNMLDTQRRMLVEYQSLYHQRPSDWQQVKQQFQALQQSSKSFVTGDCKESELTKLVSHFDPDWHSLPSSAPNHSVEALPMMIWTDKSDDLYSTLSVVLLPNREPSRPLFLWRDTGLKRVTGDHPPISHQAFAKSSHGPHVTLDDRVVNLSNTWLPFEGYCNARPVWWLDFANIQTPVDMFGSIRQATISKQLHESEGSTQHSAWSSPQDTMQTLLLSLPSDESPFATSGFTKIQATSFDDVNEWIGSSTSLMAPLPTAVNVWLELATRGYNPEQYRHWTKDPDLHRATHHGFVFDDLFALLRNRSQDTSFLRLILLHLLNDASAVVDWNDNASVRSQIETRWANEKRALVRNEARAATTE